MNLEFGAISPLIKKQLEQQGEPVDDALTRTWQKDADAITRLSVRGLLTSSQTHAARTKLMRSIVADIRAARALGKG